MPYVFGPVPSRRLGNSLGIDPVPLKTCNWNCVYCQLGRTSPLTNERRDFYPPDEIVAGVAQSLKAHRPGEIDWVTFVGSGEPTLHASLGRIIRQVKALTAIPVAVVTNGSLLYQKAVRDELQAADAVLPSLDAGSPALYRTINRPHPHCSFERLVDGLAEFRASFRGKLWVEVMLVNSLNDSEPALWDIAAILTRISPDQIHISSPTRPPVELWVAPTGEEGRRRAQAIFGESALALDPPAGSLDISPFDNAVDALVAIVSRHPMEETELIQALRRWSPARVRDLLAQLSASGNLQLVRRYGKRFWSAGRAKFPHAPGQDSA